MLRELNKAFIGFKGDSYEDAKSEDHSMKVTTGRWGCGAYNGNAELKFALQWIAASVNNRPMIFTTFREQDCKKIPDIVKMFEGKPVSDLYSKLMDLREYVSAKVNIYDIMILYRIKEQRGRVWESRTEKN